MRGCSCIGSPEWDRLSSGVPLTEEGNTRGILLRNHFFSFFVLVVDVVGCYESVYYCF